MNLREIFLGNEKTFNRKVAIFHAVILFAAVAFLYFFSYSTSPRYETFSDDSAIFQAVGFCWSQGLLPYVGAFENKGPLLFAIDAVGYLIYPRVGIFLLQVPFMYFSMLFTWRAVELFWSRSATIKIFLFAIFWRAAIFYEGNRTEEYSMPFLLAAGYFFLRWLKDEKNFCPPSLGFIYGLGFGACVLLRTTNGLPICCYVLLTTALLIRAGAFKNIWQNFLSFWAGFAVICLPFVIYFAAHGALYDMIYGTILINVLHATDFHPSHQEFMEYMVPYIIHRLNFLFLLVGASVFTLVLNRKSKLAWSGFVTGATMLFMLSKGRPFYGYPELIASLLPIFFAVVFELKKTLSPTLKKLWAIRGLSLKRIFYKAIYMCGFLFFLTCTGIQASFLIDSVVDNHDEEYLNFFRAEQTSIRELSEKIPVDERNSVVIWGESNAMSNFILLTGIKPRCRFFGNITSAFGKADPAVIDEWLETVRRDSPKWIVYGAVPEEFTGEEMNFFKRNFRRQRNSDVEKILDEKYFLAQEMPPFSQTIRLYRLRE